MGDSEYSEYDEAAYKSRTGSSRGVYKRNGEIMAVTHKVQPKSYGGPTNGASNTR